MGTVRFAFKCFDETERFLTNRPWGKADIVFALHQQLKMKIRWWLNVFHLFGHSLNFLRAWIFWSLSCFLDNLIERVVSNKYNNFSFNYFERFMPRILKSNLLKQHLQCKVYIECAMLVPTVMVPTPEILSSVRIFEGEIWICLFWGCFRLISPEGMPVPWNSVCNCAATILLVFSIVSDWSLLLRCL